MGYGLGHLDCKRVQSGDDQRGKQHKRGEVNREKDRIEDMIFFFFFFFFFLFYFSKGEGGFAGG